MLNIPVGGFILKTPYNPEKCLRIIVETPTPYITPVIDVNALQHLQYDSGYGARIRTADQKQRDLPSLRYVSPDNEFCYEYALMHLVSYQGIILMSNEGGSLVTVTTRINLINVIILWLFGLIIGCGLVALFIEPENRLDVYCFVTLLSFIIPMTNLATQLSTDHLKQALRDMLSAHSVSRREKKKSLS